MAIGEGIMGCKGSKMAIKINNVNKPKGIAQSNATWLHSRGIMSVSCDGSDCPFSKRSIILDE
jgi:hypothetical protein